MKALKNKALKAMRALEEIRTSQSTRLWFDSLPEENKRDLYSAEHEFKIFIDNLPEKKKK